MSPLVFVRHRLICMHIDMYNQKQKVRKIRKQKKVFLKSVLLYEYIIYDILYTHTAQSLGRYG